MTPFAHFKAARNRARAVSFGRDEVLAPRWFNSRLSQSLSKALSPKGASNSMPSIKGAPPTLSWHYPGSSRNRTSCRVHRPALRSWRSSCRAIGQEPDFDSPFASAPCWWPRTIGPSTIAYSKSGSPDKALKSSSNAPICAHRRKCLKVELQFPNVSGRQRHGTARHANTRGPQHRLQKHPIACCRPARVTRLARKKRRHSLPLRVIQNQSQQCRLSIR
jgi:hypothetical protein